jgi:predicted acyl esterase
VLGPNNDFAKEGYIFVYQDTRGKFKSEGEFVHHVPFTRDPAKPNESTDTWDTIDWLVKNVPGNNGRVGQYGISWAGWEVSMGMIDAHPALKASSPQAPPQDQFFGDDYHSGGAYQLMYGFNWMSTNARARVAPSERPVERFDYGTPDGYRFFLELGSAGQRAEILRRRCADVSRSHDASDLRRVLAGAQRAQGSGRDRASGADCRRLVRRAGFPWSVPHVSRAEGEESGQQDDAGGRPVAARGVGAR